MKRSEYFLHIRINQASKKQFFEHCDNLKINASDVVRYMLDAFVAGDITMEELARRRNERKSA